MKVMLKSAAAALLACLSFVPAAFSAETNEQHLQVSQLPAPVQTTLQRDGGQVQTVEKETRGRQNVLRGDPREGRQALLPSHCRRRQDLEARVPGKRVSRKDQVKRPSDVA